MLDLLGIRLHNLFYFFSMKLFQSRNSGCEFCGLNVFTHVFLVLFKLIFFSNSSFNIKFIEN